jgi:excisionase family DNA binding protein
MLNFVELRAGSPWVTELALDVVLAQKSAQTSTKSNSRSRANGGAALPAKANLTPADLADLLGVPLDEVYRMVENREIPCFRFEKLIRFPRDLLEEWLLCRQKGKG